MKKLLFLMIVLAMVGTISAQPSFNLGLKGGVNFAKMSLDMEDYNTDAVTKSHFGAFGRIGWGRVFIQPEAYYSGKGGDVTANISNTVTSFDYSTIDVPVLLGLKIIKGGAIGVHALAGPVFSGIITNDVEGSDLSNKDFYDSHFFNLQYGLGIDVLFLTLDARFEHGLNDLYNHGALNAKNQTFMVSVGFKLL